MAKIPLSPEQRAAILAGADELDVGEITPVPGPAASTPAASPPASTPVASPAPAPSADLVAYLSGQVVEKDRLLVAANAELLKAKDATAEATATQAGLLKIAQATVGQMQVALNGTDSAKAMDAKAVVAEYERVEPVYKAKLPVGGVTKPVAEGEPAVDPHPRFAERLASIPKG